MSGRKDDVGKPPLSMIPFSALWAEARVMAKGEKKYGRDNWRGGMKWTRLIDAAMRHITLFNEGEDTDDGEGGTGESHLANARCCLAFLIEYSEKGLGEDDRYVAPVYDGIRLAELSHDSRDSLAWLGYQFSGVEGELVNIRLPPGRNYGAGTIVWARPIPESFGALDFVSVFKEPSIA